MEGSPGEVTTPGSCFPLVAPDVTCPGVLTVVSARPGTPSARPRLVNHSALRAMVLLSVPVGGWGGREVAQ